MSHRTPVVGTEVLTSPDLWEVLGWTAVGGVALIAVVVWWIGLLEELQERRRERHERMRRENPP